MTDVRLPPISLPVTENNLLTPAWAAFFNQQIVPAVNANTQANAQALQSPSLTVATALLQDSTVPVSSAQSSSGTGATVAVGTTTTGAAGTSASVTNSGTPTAAVFNFTIPQGATGPAGPAPSGAANLVLATPNGSSGVSSLRALVAADIPALAYEPSLGNPGTNGYLLSSTTAGVRSWVAPYSYTLPTATNTVLGGVKPDGTSILNASGVISVTLASIGALASGGTAVLATALAGGTANQIPYQTAPGVTSFFSAANYGVQIYGSTGVPLALAGAAGVLQGSASANAAFTTTPTLTGTNFTGIPNGALSATLASIGNLANAAGVLTNNGSGTFSYTTPLTNPMTTLGDTLYGGASGAITRLAGPTTNGTYHLLSIPTASVAVAPVWTLSTGTGAPVNATSPTLVTPVLGDATATTINKVTITTPTASATLTLVTGSSLITAGAYALTLTSTATSNATLPAGTTTLMATTTSVLAAQMPALTGAVTSTAGTVATSLNTSQSAAVTWSAQQTYSSTASNGAINVSASTASTTTTTGAVVVSGGVGIGGALTVGGGISATTGTFTGAISGTTGTFTGIVSTTTSGNYPTVASTISGTGLHTYSDAGGSGITNFNPYTSGAMLYIYGTAFAFYSSGSNVAQITSAGGFIGATGAFSGSISATTGTFTGAISGTTGTFTGIVSTTTSGHYPTVASTTSGTGLYTYSDAGGSGITNSNPYTSGAMLYIYGTAFAFYSSGSNVAQITSAGGFIGATGAFSGSISATTGTFSGAITQGSYTATTSAGLALNTQYADLTIVPNAATSGAGTTITYTYTNGTNGPLVFASSSGAVLTLAGNGNAAFAGQVQITGSQGIQIASGAPGTVTNCLYQSAGTLYWNGSATPTVGAANTWSAQQTFSSTASNGAVYISATTASTSTSTGALVVAGGAAIVGNLYMSGSSNITTGGILAASNITSATISTSTYTVAGLPSGASGMRAMVTNALSPVFGLAVAGGGSQTVPVYNNGVSWLVG